MDTLVTVVHFVTAIAIIGLILIQQGKGAGMGASLGGGGSDTVFGGSGGASFFAKLTGGLAVLFFVTSLGMTLLARESAKIEGAGSILPTVETTQPAVDVHSAEPSLPVDQILPTEIPELPVHDSLPHGIDSVESATPQE